jgi:hypothetical protein
MSTKLRCLVRGVLEQEDKLLLKQGNLLMDFARVGAAFEADLSKTEIGKKATYSSFSTSWPESSTGLPSTTSHVGRWFIGNRRYRSTGPTRLHNCSQALDCLAGKQADIWPHGSIK